MRRKVYIPKDGDKRTIFVFLFTPVTIMGEWRWFEFAKIDQVYFKREPNKPYSKRSGWENVEWNDWD